MYIHTGDGKYFKEITTVLYGIEKGDEDDTDNEMNDSNTDFIPIDDTL